MHWSLSFFLSPSCSLSFRLSDSLSRCLSPSSLSLSLPRSLFLSFSFYPPPLSFAPYRSLSLRPLSIPFLSIPSQSLYFSFGNFPFTKVKCEARSKQFASKYIHMIWDSLKINNIVNYSTSSNSKSEAKSRTPDEYAEFIEEKISKLNLRRARHV